MSKSESSVTRAYGLLQLLAFVNVHLSEDVREVFVLLLLLFDERHVRSDLDDVCLGLEQLDVSGHVGLCEYRVRRSGRGRLS